MWEEETSISCICASDRARCETATTTWIWISFVWFAFLFRSLFAICDMCSLLPSSCASLSATAHIWKQTKMWKRSTFFGWSRNLLFASRNAESGSMCLDQRHVILFHLCTLDTPANTNDRGWCAWLSSVQCIPLFPRNSRTRREYIEMSVKI